MASALFSPITLRGLTMPNRVVVSPMCQYNSDEGSANDWHLMHLGNFSLGCAGLVMTEMTNVNAVGRISLKCAGLYSDANEKALKRVIDFTKQYGVAKPWLGWTRTFRLPFSLSTLAIAEPDVWLSVPGCIVARP